MDWKAKFLLRGGLIGLALGIVTSWLYMRSADVKIDKDGNPQLPAVQSADLLRIAVSLVAVLRTIVGLGASDD